MRKGSTFWGSLLFIVGILFLLDTLNIVNRPFQLAWPLLIIAVGVMFLMGPRKGSGYVEIVNASVPLEGAKKASLRLQHGAGTLRLSSGAGEGMFLSGSVPETTGIKQNRSGDRLDVRLEAGGFASAPWHWGGGVKWDLQVAQNVPVELRLESGANEARLDLRDLNVTDFRLETGASSTQIQMPASAGHTRARIETGAASVQIRIPVGVAARIKSSSGLANINVDQSRFPKIASGLYEAAEFESAENRIEINLEAGVASIDIR